MPKKHENSFETFTSASRNTAIHVRGRLPKLRFLSSSNKLKNYLSIEENAPHIEVRQIRLSWHGNFIHNHYYEARIHKSTKSYKFQKTDVHFKTLSLPVGTYRNLRNIRIYKPISCTRLVGRVVNSKYQRSCWAE